MIVSIICLSISMIVCLQLVCTCVYKLQPLQIVARLCLLGRPELDDHVHAENFPKLSSMSQQQGLPWQGKR